MTNSLALWQPQLVNTFALSTWQTGWLNALPFALAGAAMYFWGRRSDRLDERRWHIAIPLLVGALGVLGSMCVSQLGAMLLALCLAVMGASMIKGPFWAMATARLPADSAAVVIGQINALNNLGVFVAAGMIGVIRSITGSFTFALAPLLLLNLSALIGVFYLDRKSMAARALPTRADE